MQDDPMDRTESAEGDLGLPLAAPAETSAKSPYLVLARKYRPARFEDLIGQEAMVRTLSNAFDLGRIHQAYILTGVRGVGKTTTARILARAFNYELPARGTEPAVTQPTIHMPELGVHCQAIIESRHVDVIEMDAASHTGIDDVREIITNAQYRPMSARTKVYIIDEVHMLSKQAFNGLLKTLEEPPEHVRFVFATTEIEKVPVTVRSRCQRFDLRRIDTKVLIDHLAKICAAEAVGIEAEALLMIARAAEGSVRDALSLLDQAIAHCGGTRPVEVSAEAVRGMLGTADHGRIIDLFEGVMRGKIAEALSGIDELYDGGADPAQVLVDLAGFVHLVTRLKLVPAAVHDGSITPDEGRRGAELAQALSIPVLTRAWQLLLNGLEDVKDSPRPLAAAHMVLVRLAYAADLPTPDEALRKLDALQRDPIGVPVIASAGPRPPLQGRDPVVGFAAPKSSSRDHDEFGSDRSEFKNVVDSKDLEPGAGGRPGSGSPGPALAAKLCPAPGAGTSVPRLAALEDIVALAGQKRDLQLKHALERDVRLVRFEPGRIELAIVPGGARTVVQDLTRRLAEWTGERWIVAVSNEPGAPTLKDRVDAVARAQARELHDDPLVRSVLAKFPGAEIVGVRPLAPPDSDEEPDFGGEAPVDHDF
jgi:DNA polymerase-3 subunit gamma/tau